MGSRQHADMRRKAIEFLVVVVLGASPGSRRLNRWWSRQPLRRILLYRFCVAAVYVIAYVVSRRRESEHPGVAR